MRLKSSPKAVSTNKKKTNTPVIAVLGYGGQGRALALNWRDSGYSVLIALRPGSSSARKAKADRLPLVSFLQAAVLAEVIVFAIPDQTHGAVYTRWLQQNIQKDTLLIFLHGTSIAFGGVKPNKAQPLGLIAPHAPGVAVRDNFESGIPLSGFVAGNSSRALGLVKKLAADVGIPRTHQLVTSFRNEAIGDLFGEQAVLCGGLAALVATGFETLRKNGLPPTHAWLEVGFQLDLIVALMKKHGIQGMFERISVAAQHGSAEFAPQISAVLQKIMQQRYREIASGKYPDRFLFHANVSKPVLRSMTKKNSSATLEKAAREVAQLTKIAEVSAHGRRSKNKTLISGHRSIKRTPHA